MLSSTLAPLFCLSSIDDYLQRTLAAQSATVRCRRHRLQFTEARPECVSGVVYMGGGGKPTGKLANHELPSLVIRGSRDPFTPEKVPPTSHTRTVKPDPKGRHRDMCSLVTFNPQGNKVGLCTVSYHHTARVVSLGRGMHGMGVVDGCMVIDMNYLMYHCRAMRFSSPLMFRAERAYVSIGSVWIKPVAPPSLRCAARLRSGKAGYEEGGGQVAQGRRNLRSGRREQQGLRVLQPPAPRLGGARGIIKSRTNVA